MRVLECSSRGDKRFSALYAQVTIFGETKTIEKHYQEAKRGARGNVPGKGQPVDHIILKGKRLESRFLTPWYNFLWGIYLDTHPELVEYARQFDDYKDMFRGRAVNCQADSIRMYVRDREELFASTAELREVLSG
jgi:hypothetical protein